MTMKQSKNVTMKLSGLHCVSCAINIDMELEDKKGVIKTNTNYAKSITEIEFSEDIINLEEIINTIESLGYKVEKNK